MDEPRGSRPVAESFIGQQIEGGKVWLVTRITWDDGDEDYALRCRDKVRRSRTLPRIDVPYDQATDRHL